MNMCSLGVPGKVIIAQGKCKYIHIFFQSASGPMTLSDGLYL